MTSQNRPFGQIERKTWAGAVLDREFYTTVPRCTLPGKSADIRPRFRSAEEREAHKRHMARVRHTRLVNANFIPGDLYLTLTFDGKNECHSYSECWMLLSRYIRRVKRVYKHAVLFYYCGRGENTNRFHAHILAHGAPEDFLLKKWGYGKIEDVQKLWAHCFYDGIDCGANYEGLANYLFDHWEPEQGPHRYHHTRNDKKPETEYKPCRRNYTEEHPPKAPKGYKLIAVITTRYGYKCFRYVKEPAQPFLDFDYGQKKPKRSRKRRKRRTDPEE